MSENSKTKSNIPDPLNFSLLHSTDYLKSVINNAVSHFEVNISKDIIEKDFFLKENGELKSMLGMVGMSAPCSFSEFFKKWLQFRVPQEYKKEYTFFNDIKDILFEYNIIGISEVNFEYWSDGDTKKIYTNQRFVMSMNEDGDLCALSILNDITQVRLQQEAKERKQLEKYAYTDEVTGGDNYNRFKEKINANNIPGYIVAFDIHDFKIINTTCGVQKADFYLKRIWECIISSIEKEDIAAHINADHFIIYISTDDKDTLEKYLRSITLAIAMQSLELQMPQVSPYYGISYWEPGKTIELTYSEAVAAKHKISDNKAESISYFDEKDTERTIKEKQMEDSFEEALSSKEFVIWYQPKFSPITKKIVGAEALIRWIKNGQLIPPGSFIPLFERNGMIRALDEYVFKNVCQQQKKWQIAGLKVVPVSVNLSRASLYYKNLVGKYRWIIDEINLEPNLVPLEITESAAVNNSDVREIAEKFYDAGFSLHLDDFGSGYSSLASLNTLHFDTLKIDKSLVDYIGNYSGDKLLEHTISLARDLGMHVTAEGVEEESQNTYLRHIGCHSIQGYFFSKPIPINEFEKLLYHEEKTSALTERDLVVAYSDSFRMSLLKSSDFEFIVDLEANSFKGSIGHHKIDASYDTKNSTYSDLVKNASEKIIDKENAQAYLKFMDRQRILDNYIGAPESRTFYCRRRYDQKETVIRILTHTYKIKESEKLWMYVSVTDLGSSFNLL